MDPDQNHDVSSIIAQQDFQGQEIETIKEGMASFQHELAEVKSEVQTNNTESRIRFETLNRDMDRRHEETKALFQQHITESGARAEKQGTTIDRVIRVSLPIAILVATAFGVVYANDRAVEQQRTSDMASAQNQDRSEAAQERLNMDNLIAANTRDIGQLMGHVQSVLAFREAQNAKNLELDAKDAQLQGMVGRASGRAVSNSEAIQSHSNDIRSLRRGGNGG